MWTKHYRVMRSELAKCEKARSELEKMHPPHTVQPEQDGQLQDYIQKSDSLYEWRLLILTEYWMIEADRLGVPLPDRDDRTFWGRVEFDSDPREPRYLTDAGIRIVRADIREERRQRREPVTFWSSIMIGVVGALTGLASVIPNWWAD
ncbi:hypothetical protein GFL09_13505 [Pseudomonas stutzeri]|jgi:hypothetical protein|uniref:Uncharacterized protein n=5 Tax=Pseudomonadaceae TaxID=135621 RepID=A0A2S4AMT2_STUST|nr:hypothetical protein Psest_0603 [Stutzerimonas stutzeri RCH2]EWC40441.1 hypothetical protein B597_014965 [Stutzerimonas stutzeri KOS6]KIL02986.1 hypothetical protein QX25_18910 [Stutzerimonas stutzeri]KJJ60964.1 hypothetical protein RT21_22795 [Pseudomonas sp. 10B238]MBK3844785.1 hypothetical protein [Stutzerimonas xanthomarina]PKG93127.1 hypothetical protein CXF92_13435 [Pseudomonas sp. Choline-3u-10]PNF75073.1 hypothetical protein CXK95_17770 [Stutzerimonas degradans]TLX53536.1 hypothet